MNGTFDEGPVRPPQAPQGDGGAPPSPPEWATYSGGGMGGGPGHRGRRGLRAVAVAGIVVAAAAAGAGGVLAYNHFSPHNGNTIAVAQPTTRQHLQAVQSSAVNVQAVAAKVEPAVVDINVIEATGGSAAGTGMILTPSGEVLTNNHVVEGASQIRVKIAGRSGSYPARVLGVDPTKDVALLQIEGVSNLPTVTLSSTPPYVGEQVIAIGNALGLGGTPTVTEGTITALNRSITATDEFGDSGENLTGMLQTDAALAPGDSGGPLVNDLGQVVGMDTAAYSGGATAQSFSNVGFAIPINTALNIVRQIQNGQASSTVILGSRAVMGVEVTDADSPYAFQFQPATSSGALVLQVNPGSPAAAAGLVPGDVIVSFDGHAVTSVSQLSQLEAPFKPGQSVSVTWVTPMGQSETASIQLVPGPPA
jgi:S1-C subfamily serine protease